jgi:hypothetical protein
VFIVVSVKCDQLFSVITEMADICVKFCFKTAMETREMIKTIFGGNAMG